ncbi:PLP-dependent decarboxylase [Streptomyces sp. NBC_01102]|uniref:pyridoxal phosphate-dependent decarboxylase family protein n=1 Tax=unclassified Streptomyces TaxID=2593676 RepID=UPI00386B341C|nr:PLP-dependent decarboxylase [Streptomyces sp. NBC_01102]
MADVVRDWSPSEFEEHGAEVLAAIREHFELIRQVPVSRPYDAQLLLEQFDSPMPDEGEDFKTILAETRQNVVPNLVQWNHPSFFGYFPTCASFPGVLAETVTAALNVNTMLWKTSPAGSAVETVVLRWLADLAGYDTDADGLLLGGASLATMFALGAARDAALGPSVREDGIADAGRLRVYASDQAHSSIEKSVIALGFGSRNLVRIESDEHYRMRPEELEAALKEDLAAGAKPVAVVATVGTTSTGAADDLTAIARITERYGVWLHVDAAYGGFYRACPRLRGRVEDVSVGDSLVVNPQKTLLVPLDSTALFCRRKGALAESFRIVPDYLTSDQPVAFDYMDLSPQLGRGFRALKAWWVLRSFGRNGLTSHLDRSLEMAEELREDATGHADWTVIGSTPYPLVCLRYTPKPNGRPLARDECDRLNAAIVGAVNKSGQAFVSHSVLRDGYVIRVAVGNIRTTSVDVKELWRLLASTAEALHAGQRF